MKWNNSIVFVTKIALLTIMYRVAWQFMLWI